MPRAQTRSRAKGREPDASEAAHVEEFIKGAIAACKRHALQAAIIIALGVFAATVYTGRRRERDQHVAEAYGLLALALPLEKNTFGMPPPDAGDEAEEKRKVLQRVIDEFADTPAAIEAQLYGAKLDFAEEKFEAAARQFRDFYLTFPAQPPLTGLARLGEADCLVELGRLPAALEAFRLAADTKAGGDSMVAGEARYKGALCAAVAGDYKAAKELLNELLGASTDEFLRRRAESLLGKLRYVPPAEMKNLLPSPPPADADEPSPAEEQDAPAEKQDPPAEQEKAE